MAVGIAIGTGVGVLLSLAVESWGMLGVGMAIGVAFGVAFGDEAEDDGDEPQGDDEPTPSEDPRDH